MSGLWILAVLLFLAMLYLLLPAGNIFHELMHLPELWYRNARVSTAEISFRRFHYGEHSRQYCLMIPPLPGAPMRKSVIVFIHGGAWRFAKPEYFLPYAVYFAKRGFPVFMPSCRRLPRFTFKDMREDLSLLIPAIMAQCDKAGWSEREWIPGGMSSGGHLAAHMLLDPALRRLIPSVKGAMLLAAPLSLRPLRLGTVRKMLAGEPGSERFRRADPINLLTEDFAPPMLLIHGTGDGLVPIQCSRAFAEAAVDKGNGHVELHVLPGGSHLKAVSWTYLDNDLSRRLENWLTRVDAG